MSALDPRARRALLWGVPFVVAAGVLAAEAGWGARRSVPPEAPVAPSPVKVGVLPEYAVPGGEAALAATAEHPLFNPTRRPAPPALASANGGPSSMKKGQFVLTGTLVYGDTAVAYLKEVSGGKPRTVKKGEKINGITVASVDARGVRLAQGEDSEELVLKIAAGPKVTVQPVVAPPAQPAGEGGGRQGVPVPAAGQPGTPRNAPAAAPQYLRPDGTPMSPSERRRAARAAQIAATLQQGDGPSATVNPAGAGSRSPTQRNTNRTP